MLKAPSIFEPYLGEHTRVEASPSTVEEANAIVLGNLKLIFTALKAVRIPIRLIEPDDQIQIACIALIKAARTFDPSRGQFSTWAVRLITQSLGNEKHKLFTLSRGLRGKTRARFVEGEAEYYAVSESNLRVLEDKEVWDTVMMMLDDREKAILTARLREEKTLEEIGRAMKLTRERVRQIEESALKWAKAVVESRVKATMKRELSAMRLRYGFRKRAEELLCAAAKHDVGL